MKTMWFFCAAVTLIGWSCWAVPYPQQETFQKIPDAAQWQFVIGSPGDFQLGSNGLTLTNAHGPLVINYHYYPIRSTHTRPSFGNFIAQLDVKVSTASAPLRWGINVGLRNGVEVEYLPQSNQARVAQYRDGVDVKCSSWQAVPPGETVALQIIRDGNRLYFTVNETPIGTWQGVIPGIVDFSVKISGGTAVGSSTISKVSVAPLPGSTLYSSVLPRSGQKFDFDGSDAFRAIGGDRNNGYLWSKGEGAAIVLNITNLNKEPASGVIKCRILDWHDQSLRQWTVPVNIPANAEKTQAIALADDRFGFFTLETQLCSSTGNPLEAPTYTGYAITAAADPKQLSDNSVLGIHANGFGKLGIKSMRYWDNGGYALWAYLEPEKGKFRWEGIDAFVNKTVAADMVPLVVLGTTPEWASTDVSYANYCGRGSFSPPRDIADWSNYCEQIARHLRGRVKYYEIWNEPNGNELGPRGFFFYGTVEQYYELLKTAYTAIKKGDPDAVVLAPSGTGHYFPFLEKLLELGGGNYFDILSIHTYCTPFPPEIGYQFNGEKDYRYRLETSRKLLARYQVPKPIWNTEIGYHDGIDFRNGGSFLSQDDIAAEGRPDQWPNWFTGWPFRPLATQRTSAFMVRFALLSIVYDVQKCFIHHRLSENEASPFMPAPALAWMNRLMDNAHFDRAYSTAPGWAAYGFDLADGSYCVAAWRIENESLLMNAQLEKSMGKVDSAPIAGIAEQNGIQLERKSPVPPEYFDPQQAVATQVIPSVMPDQIYDFFGNLMPVEETVRLEEAPVYLIYAKKPENLTVRSCDGTRDKAPQIRSNTFDGEVIATVPAPDYPRSIEDIPGLKAVSLNKVTLSDGTIWDRSEWICLAQNQSVIVPLPQNPPASGRLIVYLRGGNELSDHFSNRYRLWVDNREVPLMPWKRMPSREIMRGDGWILFCGFMASPPMDFRNIKDIRLEVLQDNSHVIAMWVEPLDKKPVITESVMSKEKRLDLTKLQYTDGTAWDGKNWMEIQEGKVLKITPTGRDLPKSGRLLFALRSGNTTRDFQFRYQLSVNGKNAPLQECEPMVMVMKGNGWAIVKGYLMSPPVRLGIDDVRFEAFQGSSHLFDIYVLTK